MCRDFLSELWFPTKTFHKYSFASSRLINNRRIHSATIGKKSIGLPFLNYQPSNHFPRRCLQPMTTRSTGQKSKLIHYRLVNTPCYWREVLSSPLQKKRWRYNSFMFPTSPML